MLTATVSPAQDRLSPEQQRSFLLAADIVASEPIGSGITGASRVTLSDGTLTHDAAFQPVDFPLRPGAETGTVVDSYRYAIAAYRLAEIVGLADMLPVTVPRTWRGTPGALSWWIDDVMFDEEQRLAERRWPPDLDAWGAQTDRMWVFAELVGDADRHAGNLIYTTDWTLYMVDFTRAFGLEVELMKPYRLDRIDAPLLRRFEALTERTITEATAPYLSPEQVTALLSRRDRIVAHARSLPPR